jgi:fatty-acyl-CoA synthase
MLNNTPEMFECHFGVPMTGAVLNTLNTRLDAESIGFMLKHGEARVLITDREYSPTVKKALADLGREIVVDRRRRLQNTAGPGERLGKHEYEAFIASGRPDYAWKTPDDEWDAISLNYTSGTTGNPKGVVYHHRGAYLNALVEHRLLGHATAGDLPVDPADVPLQRLVLSPGPWRPIPAPMSACAASIRS